MKLLKNGQAFLKLLKDERFFSSGICEGNRSPVPLEDRVLLNEPNVIGLFRGLDGWEAVAFKPVEG